MTLAALDEERTTLMTELRGLIAKVPPGHSEWMFHRTHDYIVALADAQILLKKPKPPTADLSTMITRMRGFWK